MAGDRHRRDDNLPWPPPHSFPSGPYGHPPPQEDQYYGSESYYRTGHRREDNLPRPGHDSRYFFPSSPHNGDSRSGGGYDHQARLAQRIREIEARTALEQAAPRQGAPPTMHAAPVRHPSPSPPPPHQHQDNVPPGGGSDLQARLARRIEEIRARGAQEQAAPRQDAPPPAQADLTSRQAVPDANSTSPTPSALGQGASTVAGTGSMFSWKKPSHVPAKAATTAGQATTQPTATHTAWASQPSATPAQQRKAQPSATTPHPAPNAPGEVSRSALSNAAEFPVLPAGSAAPAAQVPYDVRLSTPAIVSGGRMFGVEGLRNRNRAAGANAGGGAAARARAAAHNRPQPAPMPVKAARGPGTTEEAYLAKLAIRLRPPHQADAKKLPVATDFDKVFTWCMAIPGPKTADTLSAAVNKATGQQKVRDLAHYRAIVSKVSREWHQTNGFMQTCSRCHTLRRSCDGGMPCIECERDSTPDAIVHCCYSTCRNRDCKYDDCPYVHEDYHHALQHAFASKGLNARASADALRDYRQWETYHDMFHDDAKKQSHHYLPHRIAQMPDKLQDMSLALGDPKRFLEKHRVAHEARQQEKKADAHRKASQHQKEQAVARNDQARANNVRAREDRRAQYGEVGLPMQLPPETLERFGFGNNEAMKKAAGASYRIQLDNLQAQHRLQRDAEFIAQEEEREEREARNRAAVESATHGMDVALGHDAATMARGAAGWRNFAQAAPLQYQQEAAHSNLRRFDAPRPLPEHVFHETFRKTIPGALGEPRRYEAKATEPKRFQPGEKWAETEDDGEEPSAIEQPAGEHFVQKQDAEEQDTSAQASAEAKGGDADPKRPSQQK